MTSRPRLHKRILKASVAAAALAFLVWILLALAGVFRERIEPGTSEARSTVPLEPGSTVVPVTVREVPLIERSPGTVQAIRDAVVAARMTAQVLEVSCRPGARVAAGELLAKLDARDLEARAAQAEEGLAAANAEAEDARAALARLETVKSSGSEAVSARELEAASARVAGAMANVGRARRQIDEARVNVGFAELTAPFDAVIIDRYLEPGDIATVGLPICRLYDPSSMRLEAFVRESLAVHLRSGDPVQVELAARGTSVPGTVQEIVPQSQPGSRSLLVKVALDDVEGLYPGLFGRLELEAGVRTMISVPRAAVHAVGQLRYVLLEDGTRRHVTLGSVHGDDVEVLSGLARGARVRVVGVPSAGGEGPR